MPSITAQLQMGIRGLELETLADAQGGRYAHSAGAGDIASLLSPGTKNQLQVLRYRPEACGRDQHARQLRPAAARYQGTLQHNVADLITMFHA